ncbi:MAG: vWA domain-containing protein [Verrucomicrobiia bacterium]
MNRRHKKGTFFACLVTLQLFCSCFLQAQSPNSKFIFVVDLSSSMSQKSLATSLAVAGLVEKGVSGKMHDGDIIEIWTYGEKIRTTEFKPLFWRSTEPRDISNLVFLFLKNLRYSKKTIDDISFNNLREILSNKNSSPVYLYIVTDGAKPVKELPFETELNKILSQNFNRWKNDKIPCVIAILIENNEIIDWAVGEAYPLSPVKTIARSQPTRKVEERRNISATSKETEINEPKVVKDLQPQKTTAEDRPEKNLNEQKSENKVMDKPDIQKNSSAAIVVAQINETARTESVKPNRPVVVGTNQNILINSETNRIKPAVTVRGEKNPNQSTNKQDKPNISGESVKIATNQSEIKSVSNVVKSNVVNIAPPIKKDSEQKQVEAKNSVTNAQNSLNNQIINPPETAFLLTNQIKNNVEIKTNENSGQNLITQSNSTGKKLESNKYENTNNAGVITNIVKIETNIVSLVKTNLTKNLTGSGTIATMSGRAGETNPTELTITQNIAVLPDAKGSNDLLKIAIVFAFSAFGLWILGYIKLRKSYRHSLITRGMDKNKISNKRQNG